MGSLLRVRAYVRALIWREVCAELDAAQIVLIADNVDVDIDEPAVTLRFSVVACGANFTLPGS